MILRISLKIVILIFLLCGCAGLGLHKKTELMPDEFKLKPEWNEDKEGDFHINRIGAEFVWKFK